MKAISRYLSVLSTIVGLSLFAGLLYLTGTATIVDQIRLLGLGFLFVIFYSGVRHYLRTISWWLCLRTMQQGVDLSDLFRIRLLGEAFHDMSPAGPVLGDTVKVLATSNRTSPESSAASLVVESLIYTLSVVLFLLSAAVPMLIGIAMPGREQVFLGGLIAFVAFSTFVSFRIVNQRRLLLGWILDRLKESKLRLGFLERHDRRIRAFEKTIHDFFCGRRKLFFVILLIEVLTNLAGVGEAYFILNATGKHVSLLTAYFVESANRMAQVICAFVPFGLGVEEGSAAAALVALGYGASAGVSLGIIRKIRTAFWVAVGLLLGTQGPVPRLARQEAAQL